MERSTQNPDFVGWGGEFFAFLLELANALLGGFLAAQLVESPNRFLSTTQIGITLVG